MRALLLAVLAISANADTGNAVCARCHPAIARSYAQTSMARTSGRTGQSVFKEEFGHSNVTADYRLQVGDTSQRLEWFLGSGHIGRSYLFRKAGQLFQSPLSYYSQPKRWDTSPGYENKPYLEMTRAVEPACLQCHASRLQPATSPQPFLEPGVSCERCHGPGERHAAQPAKTNIVNPVRLAPPQRDSVCAQCHLTGAARIARAGRERGSYTPGALLSDSVAVFVWDASAGGGPTATSHYEKLFQSRCKQASGDKLWCGTCHTPHGDASAARYDQACQTCHQPGGCKAKENDRCVSCHMPKASAAQSTSHLVFTDHAIPRRQQPTGSNSPARLKEFWTGKSNPRDTALAYAIAKPDEAYPKLEEVAKSTPADIALLIQLAQAHERNNRDAEAVAVYTKVLQLDPGNATAAVNLGTQEIRRGRAKEAMELWRRALSRSPWLIGARLNLAVAQYQSGDSVAARASLRAVLDYEPDHPTARKMLDQLLP